MNLIFFISKRFLKEKSRKKGLLVSLITLVSILGIFLGVMVPIVVISILNGLQSEMKSKILGINGHLTILSSATTNIGNYRYLKKQILNEKNVVSVNPTIEAQGLLNVDNDVDPILLKGIEQAIFDEDDDFKKNCKIIQGSNDVSKRYYALIGAEIAKKHYLLPGDRLTATVILNAKKNKIIPLYISGIFKTGYYQYDATSIYVSLITLQKEFSLQGKVKNLDIKVRDIWQTQSLLATLYSKYPEFLHIVTWQQLNENLFKALASEKILLTLIILLILLVATFNIMSTQIMLVIDKKKTIAILKAMGMPSLKITQIFLLEGLLTTFIGSALGLVCGIAIAKNINQCIQFIEEIVNFFVRIYSKGVEPFFTKVTSSHSRISFISRRSLLFR